MPLSDRDYLDNIWQVPKWMESVKGIPGFKRMFMDRLATTYESAKSFVIAQEEVAKLVDSLVANTEGDIGNSQRGASTNNCHYVRLMVSIHREGCNNNLNFIAQIFWKQRAQWTVS